MKRWQIVFVDAAKRTVLERTTMHGPKAQVRAWAEGYSSFLGYEVRDALGYPKRNISFALSEEP